MRYKLALLFILACPAFAALGVNTVFELNSGATANNVNGGGFNPRNANMATDLSCTSPTGTAPVCSSASYNFGTIAADTGAWLFVQAGTNWNTNGAGNNGKGGGCWYKISSVAANAATVNATAGAAVCISDGIAGAGANTASNCIVCWVTNSLQGIANSSYVSGTASGTWSVDYSQSTAAGITYTDMAATTTTYTSATTPVGKSIIGNLISVNSGTTCTVQRVEVVSTSGTTATIDKTIGGSGLTCSGNLGGAISLGSAVTNNTDTTLFALGAGTNGTGAMVFWIKGASAATYTLGSTVTLAVSCATQAHCVIAGYNALRNDLPTIASGNQPIINTGANIFGGASTVAWDFWNLQMVGSGTTVFSNGGQLNVYNCKITNQSTTAARNAVDLQSAQAIINASEIVSYRGVGVKLESNSQAIYGTWIHDSDTAVSDVSSANGIFFERNLISNNVTVGFQDSAAGGKYLTFNTFYGREAKQGTCVNIQTTSTYVSIRNSIFYGCTTGVAQTDTSQVGFDDYNDYNNNTTDATIWFKGSHDLALNPTFAAITEHTCLGTCSSATNVVTDTGAGFNAYVVNDVTFFHCLTNCGTGGAGVYPIHAHTNTTLTLATPQAVAVTIGTASNQTYFVTSGLNWGVTAAGVKAVAFPGLMGSSSTTGFSDLGAVQSQAAAAATQHNSAFVQ